MKNLLRKIICVCLTVALCVTLSSCNGAVSAQRVALPKGTSSLEKFNDGFLTQGYNDGQLFMCFLDADFEVVWERKVDDICSVPDNDTIFERRGSGGALLNKDGGVIRNVYQFKGYYYHGRIVSDRSGGYFLLGTLIENNNDCLINADENFGIIKTFALLQAQYPNIYFPPDQDSILLYGRAFGHEEYGFIYELDRDFNQKKYLEFENVPRNAVKLADGRWLVSFYDSTTDTVDNLKVFDADWQEISAIKFDYSFTSLYALNDGGFAVTGRGNPTLVQPVEVLPMDGFALEWDLFYERYNAKGKLKSRKIYPAKESSDGRGYISFVDADGKLFMS